MLLFYNLEEQLWPIVLEKSLAILYGGYENLEKATIEELFHNLTGSNSISLKIHEDISKSKNFLKHLS